MKSIVICEDSPDQLRRLSKVVENYLLIEDLPLTLSLATSKADDVLNYLQEHPKGETLYFLDIDLGDETIDGIGLANKIRQEDDLSKIAFVTTLDYKLPLTFKYRLEAIDFIVKDDYDHVDEQVRRCIDTVLERSQLNPDKRDKFLVQVGVRTQSLPVEDIYYFQAAEAHKIILLGNDIYIEYYDTLKNIEKAHPNFLRVHRSYVVNTQAIESFNRSAMELTFPEGMTVPVGRTRLQAVQEAIETLNLN